MRLSKIKPIVCFFFYFFFALVIILFSTPAWLHTAPIQSTNFIVDGFLLLIRHKCYIQSTWIFSMQRFCSNYPLAPINTFKYLIVCMCLFLHSTRAHGSPMLLCVYVNIVVEFDENRKKKVTKTVEMLKTLCFSSHFFVQTDFG